MLKLDIVHTKQMGNKIFCWSLWSIFEQWFTRKIVKLNYLYYFRKIQTIPLFESEITLPSLKYNSAICPEGEIIVRNQRKDREGNHLDWVW